MSHDTLVQLMGNYGLFIIFFLAIFEGPIIAVIAGYLVRSGHFAWASVLCILVAADLAGDTLLYWIGAQEHHETIAKWRKKAGLTDERLAQLQTRFAERGGWIILFGKLAHAPGMAILLAAGMSHMHYGRYLFFNLLGTVPKTLLLMTAGYVLGAAFGRVEQYLLHYSLIGIGVTVAAFFLYRQRQWKKERFE